jgi:hypothetical protein
LPCRKLSKIGETAVKKAITERKEAKAACKSLLQHYGNKLGGEFQRTELKRGGIIN